MLVPCIHRLTIRYIKRKHVSTALGVWHDVYICCLLLICRLQATQGFTPNRVHVWQLMEDVTIGGPNCTWSPPINITGPTTLLGEVASQSTNPSMRSYPLAAAVPAARARGPEPAALLPVGPTLPAASGNAVHTLSFQYTPGLIQLPVDAPDRYLQIRNITLRQLPQARAPHGPGEGRSAQNNSRRLMQAAPPPVVGGLAAMPADAHSGLFTILLWAFNRWGRVEAYGIPLSTCSVRLSEVRSMPWLRCSKGTHCGAVSSLRVSVLALLCFCCLFVTVLLQIVNISGCRRSMVCIKQYAILIVLLLQDSVWRPSYDYKLAACDTPAGMGALRASSDERASFRHRLGRW